jgi:hypothetical protein
MALLHSVGRLVLLSAELAKPDDNPNEYFSKLVNEMIDNTEGVLAA